MPLDLLVDDIALILGGYSEFSAGDAREIIDLVAPLWIELDAEAAFRRSGWERPGVPRSPHGLFDALAFFAAPPRRMTVRVQNGAGNSSRWRSSRRKAARPPADGSAECVAT